VLDGAVLRAESRDVRDDHVAVVDGVLDGDDVLLAVYLRDVYFDPDLAGVRVEVLDVQFDVILGGTPAPAENLLHEAHRRMTRSPPA